MSNCNCDSLQSQLDIINQKLDTIINKPTPHEYISFYFITLLIVLGIITTLWAKNLNSYLGLEKGRNPVMSWIITIIALIVLFMLILVIDKRLNNSGPI